MNDIIKILIGVVVVGGVFAFLWRAGHLDRLKKYVHQTREELNKCSWPTWNELKISTAVVFIAIVLLGGFTVAVDFILMKLVLLIS